MTQLIPILEKTVSPGKTNDIYVVFSLKYWKNWDFPFYGRPSLVVCVVVVVAVAIVACLYMLDCFKSNDTHIVCQSLNFNQFYTKPFWFWNFSCKFNWLFHFSSCKVLFSITFFSQLLRPKLTHCAMQIWRWCYENCYATIFVALVYIGI